MRSFFIKSPRSLLSSVTLCTSLVNLLGADFCYTQNEDSLLLAATEVSIRNQDEPKNDEPKYTVNFNNVPVIEVIRFASKITRTNFVFEEGDLQFAVTIVSEEPVSVRNIMSALIQVLRIHDLRLLEEENNLIITKNPAVNQISTLVSAEFPESSKTQAPIVTRVFRIKNTSASSIASIIRPMVSASSQIEVSEETRQLIVTDVTTNIDKIASLLVSLDTPHTRLEIESYVVKHIAVQDIVSLTQQILSAFAEGNPLILVPHLKTNTVFVVSTPYLIEKAMTVMEDLDTPPKSMVITPTLGEDNVYMYKILNKPAGEVISDLKTISKQLEASHPDTPSFLTHVIDSSKYIPETNSLVFFTDSVTWGKLETLLKAIDAPSSTGNTVWIYKIQNLNTSQMESALTQMASKIQDNELVQALKNAQWIKENNSIIFNGSESVLKKLQTIVPALDESFTHLENNTLWVYKIQNLNTSQMESALMQMSSKAQDKELIRVLASAQWIKESNSVIFNGPESTLKKLQTIIPALDAPLISEENHYVYRLGNASESVFRSSLKEMAEGMHDSELVALIKEAKWVKENNTLIFTGSSEAIKKLQNLLPSIETRQQDTLAAKGHFLIFNPVHQKGETLQRDLQELTRNLRTSGLENNQFLITLDSIKWVPETNSLIFTGDEESLGRVKGILTNLDQQTANNAPIQVFVYKPEYTSPEQLKSALELFAHNLKTSNISDQELAIVIQNAQWMSDNGSVLFKGSTETLNRLKETLLSLDNPNALGGASSHGFYLYKLQSAPGNLVIQNLKQLSENISSSDPKNAAVIKSVHSLKWVKENNALLITGSPYTIEQVKALISEFDTPGGQNTLSAKTEFFIYKPTTQTPDHIQTALDEYAKDLEHSGLSDPDFLHTLRTLKVVPATKSLLFTGTPEALTKLKHLLTTIDSSSDHPTPIQTIGATTFLIYKVQNASTPELMNSLQTFSKQLSTADVADKKLASVLDTVKWIKETNSLLLTGPEDQLQKAEKIIEKFDIGTLQAPTRAGAATFFVYEPKYQSGEELTLILTEFMDNLTRSGVSDPALFEAIHHLKFIDKTNSLIISGDTESIDKIKDLLVKFDIPGKEPLQPTISTIDSANFLVYKLQYHKGGEIQMALKKVAASLSTDKEANTALIHCISSLQWIEVTNSLLGTGDAEVLNKVKTLIQSLDVPLKQVFIEVLVVQTDLENSQSFGLQWGSQLQYLNKTIGAMGNFPTDGSNVLQKPISLTTAANPPVQGGSSSNSVPFVSGFDLGVIGDIIFHKGQSFLSLGSLMNALQVDTDSTVIMNPKIMTQDGHTSNIFVGDNIPFVGSFVSNTSQNTVQTSNLEYRDVGFNLVVTPTLGTNNIITLEINQDVSSVVPTPSTSGSSNVQGITTHHATMTTRVHVPDRHFLVLSGMIKDTKRHERTGIPCLGGLPMIGALFSHDLIEDTKSNVIIFMKPYIVNSFEEYDSLTEQELTLYKNEAVLPDIKEGIDGYVETLKDIE